MDLTNTKIIYNP